MPTKTIKQEIVLEWTKTKKGVICNNVHTLQYLWGSKTGSTDLCAWYGVERVKEGYLIPYSILKKRLGKLEYDKLRIDTSINVIKKVLEDDTNKRKNRKS